MKNIEMSKGNMKVPYYIINMGSATDCPSARLGLCQLVAICYARKAERLRPTVLSFRRRQAVQWDSNTAADLAAGIMAVQRRARKMPKVLRFSESGDFRTQADVNKLAAMGKLLVSKGWKMYGYTTRTDLDLKPLLSVGVRVNVSNDRGAWIEHGANRFLAVDNLTGTRYACPGDCRKCSVCIKKTGLTIEVLKH